ncbi:MAG TPA: VCBS domain-containing protein, partial [Gammaproteobacteria bacterium]|nr:VCBS domain-containing protein [Gammaproteobacteria bacterium]
MKTAYRGAVRYAFSVVPAILMSFAAMMAQAAPGGGGGGGAIGNVSCSIDDPGAITVNSPVDITATVSGGKPPYTYTWSATNANWQGANDPVFTPTFTSLGAQTVSLHVEDTRNNNPKMCDTSLQVTVDAAGGSPVASGDTYGTPLGKVLNVQRSRISGVLYNDYDTDPLTGDDIGNAGLTAVLDSGPAHAVSFTLNPDGSFSYQDDGSLAQNSNDSFTYYSMDGEGNTSDVVTVNIHIESDQPDFKIMVNYELGMHCTGFEFSYCCVLPPYNSIVAQIVKPQSSAFPASNADYPRLLEADPVNGLDMLGRARVLRDYQDDGTINKYFVEYFHDAQPRLEGNSPLTQTSTLISAVEGNSLLYWNTPYDSAMVDPDGSITGVPGKLVTGTYAGLNNVVLGDGSYTTPCSTGPAGCTDNFANGWLNHFYIYADLEGSNPGDSSLEIDKIRLGVANNVEYPADSGASLQPMG